MEESQYYILYDDGTKSVPHNLDELPLIKDITKETLIIKNNDIPKPAAAFIDLTDNRQTRLPDELNTFNIGACILAPLWGYNNLQKYKIYWGTYIIILLLLFLKILIYININKEAGGIVLPLAYLIFISCIPASAISILYLIDGNEIAWKNRKFKNIEQFKDIQRKWNIWGYCLCGSGILYLIIFNILNSISNKSY